MSALLPRPPPLLQASSDIRERQRRTRVAGAMPSQPWDALEDDYIANSPVVWVRVRIDPDMMWLAHVSPSQKAFQWRHQLYADRDVVAQHQGQGPRRAVWVFAQAPAVVSSATDSGRCVDDREHCARLAGARTYAAITELRRLPPSLLTATAFFRCAADARNFYRIRAEVRSGSSSRRGPGGARTHARPSTWAGTACTARRRSKEWRPVSTRARSWPACDCCAACMWFATAWGKLWTRRRRFRPRATLAQPPSSPTCVLATTSR